MVRSISFIPPPPQTQVCFLCWAGSLADSGWPQVGLRFFLP